MEGISRRYRPGDAIADLIAHTIAGRTAYMMAPISLALANIRAGKLRALGVAIKKRSALPPKVPTIAEAGAAGFDYPFGMEYGRPSALLPER